jgi:hypothetical protein
MAFLEVRRVTGGFGVIRQLNVELDGEVVLSLSRGSTGTVEVPPGRHTVVARMNWASSPPLEITCVEGEATHVEVVAAPPRESTKWKIPFVWLRYKPGSMFKLRLVE